MSSELNSVLLIVSWMYCEKLSKASPDFSCIVIYFFDALFDLNNSWHVKTGKWSDSLETNIPEVPLTFPAESLQKILSIKVARREANLVGNVIWDIYLVKQTYQITLGSCLFGRSQVNLHYSHLQK